MQGIEIFLNIPISSSRVIFNIIKWCMMNRKFLALLLSVSIYGLNSAHAMFSYQDAQSSYCTDQEVDPQKARARFMESIKPHVIEDGYFWQKTSESLMPNYSPISGLLYS